MEEDVEFLKMKKLREDIRKLNTERTILYSRKRLMDSVKKRMQTAMIGTIASIEETFGSLWGHNKKHEERTNAEKIFFDKWQELRTTILDKGNIQIRSALDEITNYTITFNNYRVEFLVKPNTNTNSGEK